MAPDDPNNLPLNAYQILPTFLGVAPDGNAYTRRNESSKRGDIVDALPQSRAIVEARFNKPVSRDRQILIEPCFVAKAVTEMSRPTRVFPEVTVLELKFTERFPNWLRELTRRFNLMQFSSAKYAEGVILMGEGRFHDGEQNRDWTGLNPREAWTAADAGGERREAEAA